MKKVEIHIGGTHYFQVIGSSEIFSGKIIEKVGNKYVCEIADKKIPAFYHIHKNGEVVIYDQLPAFHSNELKEGIFFLDIPMVPNSIYLFKGKPFETEHSCLVIDQFSSRSFIINKKDGKITPYTKGIDQEIDVVCATLFEDGPCRRHGELE
jgi:hypothetical protein